MRDEANSWAIVGLTALTLVLMLLAHGCAWLGFAPSDTQPREGQEQAAWIVWHDAYHREDVPPLIRWVEGAGLTCTDPNSGKRGFHTAVGCREGLTLSPLDVRVAWHDGDTLDGTALAHELWHAAQARGGVFDPLHQSPGFKPLDACGPCALVTVARSTSASRCWPDGTGGQACSARDESPCGECGIVQRANEALQRSGL